MAAGWKRVKSGCSFGELDQRDRTGTKGSNVHVNMGMSRTLKLTCLILHGVFRQPMLVLVLVGSTKGPLANDRDTG